ncbi:MAG: CDP-glycerol glycerophosphotransferase family protein [Patescibacteria group bacterium]
MKTIFITIFEGVEAKNLLRTDVLKTILGDPDVRVVLFTKDRNRADNYRKEFATSRVICETVNFPEISGSDKWFMRLKFTLLRTESTDLWRRLLYEKRRNYLLYKLGDIVNAILARPFAVRMFRYLDYLLVKNNIFARYFDEYRPDLVFLANLFDDTEVHMLREAKRRMIKSIGLINSWDRTTSRCILRLLPDKCVVFNNIIKNDLEKFDLVLDEDIFVSGLPQYDFHFNAPYASREKFFAELGLDPSRKILLYAPFGLAYSNADWEIIELLSRLNEQRRFAEKVSILVRCPPNDEVEASKFRRLPGVVYEFPGERFSKNKGNDWDMTGEELRHLSDSLYYMSVMVCYASSISIDAAVFDKPVININFDVGEDTPGKPSPRRHYVKRHYAQALVTGGIRLVANEDELVKWVNVYLNNPSLDREKRQILVSRQCAYLDGKSGERIGRFILENMN